MAMTTNHVMGAECPRLESDEILGNGTFLNSIHHNKSYLFHLVSYIQLRNLLKTVQKNKYTSEIDFLISIQVCQS